MPLNLECLTPTTCSPMTTNRLHAMFLHTAAQLTLAFGLLQLLLTLFSWIVNAADIGLSVRSLLAADGTRWFFGSFCSELASFPLVWMVLVLVAVGTFRASGLSHAFGSVLLRRPLAYRSRIALIMAVSLAALMCLAVGLLAFTPHAVLLSVTGNVFPSPFSDSLVPAAAFILTVSSLAYGLQSGSLATLDSVILALSHGIRIAAPLFPLYVTGMTFWRSLCFVFSL